LIREIIDGDKTHFPLLFCHLYFSRAWKREEKRGLRRAWRSEGEGARSSEGGEAWRSKEGLPSTRVIEVSANPKLPHFCHCCLYFFSSLSYSFPFFLLAHFIAGCPSIFIFQYGVLLASMYHSTFGFHDGKGEQE